MKMKDLKISAFISLFIYFSPAVFAQTSAELIDQANQALATHAYRTALIHLKNAAKETPENAQIRLKMAQIFITTGQGVQAEVEIDKAEKLGAKPSETAVLLAKAKLLQGKYDEITENIDLLDLPQREIARLRAIQGHAFFEQRKFNQARQMFQRAMHLAPDQLEVKLAKARFLQLENQTDQLGELISHLLKKYPENAEVLLIAANSYRRNNQFPLALKLYKHAGEIQPSNVNLWFGIVRSYIGMGNYNDAKIEIQKVLTSHPEHQVANYLLAVIAYEEGDYNRARSAIEIVLKGDKRKFEALKLLSSIQFQQKEYSEAEKNLKKYLKFHPADNDAQKSLAAIYLKRKQGVMALNVLKKLEHKNDSYIYSMMATAYLQIGNKQKANEYFNKSLQLAPGDRTIQRHIQLTKLESGETLEVEFNDKEYDNFATKGRIPILNYLRKKDYDRAIEIINGYLGKTPDNAVLHYLLGSAYLYKNKDKLATKEFKRSIKFDSELIEPHIYLAKIYQKQNDVRAAERQYREVLRIQKNNDQAMVALAGISARKGDQAEMLKWLNKSRRENSASLASREVLERYYRKEGEREKALEISMEMVQIQPQNVSLLLRLANNQKAVKRFDLAIKTFQKIVSLRPDLSSSWMGLARLQLLTGNSVEAEKGFLKALEIDNSILAAKVVLTQIQLKAKKYRVALKWTKRIKKEHPQSPAGWDMAGDIYIAMNKPLQAIDQYKKSITLKYDSDTYLKLFSAYNRNNQQALALQQLTVWVKQNPDDLRLKEALAITYDRRGELKKSLSLYQQILQKIRNNDRILNSAALVALQLNNPMSLEYADLALSINSHSAKNRDTFGWILFKTNNDLSKAEKLLREAVKSAPSDPDFRYHLAALLASKGNGAGALKNLYLTMGTQSEFENKAAALKLLNRLKKKR